tara:strand:+ start:11121 stop:12098 length:978 start_codon:yes stop_codon:yes gene_type:complete
LENLKEEKENILYVFNKICSLKKIEPHNPAESEIENVMNLKIDTYLEEEKNHNEKVDFISRLLNIKIKSKNSSDTKLLKSKSQPSKNFFYNDASDMIVNHLLKNKKLLVPFFEDNLDLFYELVMTSTMNIFNYRPKIGNIKNKEKLMQKSYEKIFEKALNKKKEIDINEEKVIGSFFILNVTKHKIYETFLNKTKNKEETRKQIKELFFTATDNEYNWLREEKENDMDVKEKLFYYLFAIPFSIIVLPMLLLYTIKYLVDSELAKRESERVTETEIDYYNYLLKVDGSDISLLPSLLEHRIKNPSAFCEEGCLLEPDLFELVYKI